MNTLRLIKRLWQSLPLSDQNRWWITTLLLKPILPFIQGGVIHTAYLREKEWQQKHIRPYHGDPFPPLPKQTKPDIIFWGVIDWHLRIQRPQHLARGFAARGHRVFYISTTFINTGRAGFEMERLDNEGCLFNIRFHMKGRPSIRYAPSDSGDVSHLKANMVALLGWTSSKSIVSIVQHPYWYEPVRKLPTSRLIYDCMDYHEGFGHNGEGIAALELALIEEAEAVVTTSQWLRDVAITHNPNVTLIRNAAEYDFFSVKPCSIFQDPQGRRVLGYYGAIAKWMDVELLEKIAQQFSDCLLLLVGGDECSARKRLAALTNVQFTGEVKYAKLPYYLYGMDVCLLPFQVMPLTLATNPVKVYEYLSAGKPVVSITLPELDQFGSLVATARSHEEFIQRIHEMLANPRDDQQLHRQKFASQQTWEHRIDAFNSLLNKMR